VDNSSISRINELYEDWLDKSVEYLTKVLGGDTLVSKEGVTEACDRFKEVLKNEPNRTYFKKMKSSDMFLSYELLDDGSIRERVVINDNR